MPDTDDPITLKNPTVPQWFGAILFCALLGAAGAAALTAMATAFDSPPELREPDYTMMTPDEAECARQFYRIQVALRELER